jgi:hypothetical protein
MRLTARLFLAFIFLLASFLLFKPAVYAQTLPQTAQSQQIQQTIYSNTNPDVPKTLHTFTQNVMIEVMSAMVCQLAGIDPVDKSQSCLGVDPKTKKIGFVKNGGGLIGVLRGSIVTLYTPPLHTGDYLTYLASNFGVVKKSYAAANDPGFAGLSPLQNIWLASRNVAYLFFVLLFLIVGIGIMLRVHIDPRTVMTIQNQIPKIIIALILVTFSFAIAGLLVDLMYVVCYLLLGIISSSDPTLMKIGPDIVLRMVTSTNPFDAANTVLTHGTSVNVPLLGSIQFGLGDLASGPAGIASAFVARLLQNSSGGLLVNLLGALIGGLIGHAAGSAAAGMSTLAIVGIGLLGVAAIILTGGAAAIPEAVAFGGGSLGVAASTGKVLDTILSGGGAVAGFLTAGDLLITVAGIITFLIVFCAILVTLFRLWFQLIMAYISVLINIVFAPVWIMLGLIPTSKISFTSWLRTLVGNLSCFPTALVMFLLARVFIDAFQVAGNQNFFVAPLVGNILDAKGFASIIGMGIFLMTPSAVTSVKNAITGSAGLTFGGVGAGLSSGAAVPMAGLKGVAAVNMKTQMPGESAGLVRGLAKTVGIAP